MFKKVLFPTDFSSNSNNALSHAVEMANFSNGELIVQHVVSYYFETHPHWTTLFDIHELQKYMDFFNEEEMSKALAPLSGKLSIRKVISKGKPAEEISALAEKEMVDLVVMGSAKGVITNKVIRTTTRPVLAVSSTLQPAGNPDNVYRILVATDLSPHSREVVRYAFELKANLNATIYLAHVIETTKAIEFALERGHYGQAREKMREWARNQLINLTPDKEIGNPRVVRIVEEGDPTERIAILANELGADVTILGTHEHGRIHRHLLGTTTDKLLSRLSTPVLSLKL